MIMKGNSKNINLPPYIHNLPFYQDDISLEK